LEFLKQQGFTPLYGRWNSTISVKQK
jgi:hypothetical protein